MAINSVGYDGTINETQWAILSSYLGSVQCVADPTALAVTPVAGADRTVRIAPGVAYAYGVTDTVTASIDVQLPIIASGSRWDVIVVRRNWQPTQGVTTVVSVQGTATQQIPGGLNASPGVIFDQPIALVQVKAGSQSPTGLVDLRFVKTDLGVDGSGAVTVLVGGGRRALAFRTANDVDPEEWTPAAFSNGTLGWNPFSARGIRSRVGGQVQASGTVDLGDNGPMFPNSGTAQMSLPFPTSHHGSGDSIGTWTYTDSANQVRLSGVLMIGGDINGVVKAFCLGPTGQAQVATSNRFRLACTFNYYAP